MVRHGDDWCVTGGRVGYRGDMGTSDAFENKAEELKGKAKEAVGRATGNEQWQAEGVAEQVSSGLKQAGEKAKDAARKVKDTLTGESADDEG
jgi:uncharacterized protein YjbJ (UPF0337 family)